MAAREIQTRRRNGGGNISDTTESENLSRHYSISEEGVGIESTVLEEVNEDEIETCK